MPYIPPKNSALTLQPQQSPICYTYTCASSAFNHGMITRVYYCFPCCTVKKVKGIQYQVSFETCQEPMTRLHLKMMSLELLGHCPSP